jgi:cell division protein FtsB
MVIRKRLRSVLLPLALYAASGSIAAYFVSNANHGERGLEAKRRYKAQMLQLNAEVTVLKDERATWERRVALMNGRGIDRDLLEEQARLLLGRVHRNDVVIMLGPSGPSRAAE